MSDSNSYTYTTTFDYTADYANSEWLNLHSPTITTSGLTTELENIELRKKVDDQEKKIDELMEKLCWLEENKEVLEDFPSLQKAYKEYMLLKKLVLGD